LFVRKLATFLTPEAASKTKQDFGAVLELEEEWRQLLKDRDELRKVFQTRAASVVLPCNLQRLIWNAKTLFHVTQQDRSDLPPVKVVQGQHSSENN
jgi:DNA-directed RNA polymerase II subunit RPB1